MARQLGRETIHNRPQTIAVKKKMTGREKLTLNIERSIKTQG